MSRKQLCECCSKPALTLHLKNNYTFTIAALVLLSSVFLMHICMFKCKKKHKSRKKSDE